MGGECDDEGWIVNIDDRRRFKCQRLPVMVHGIMVVENVYRGKKIIRTKFPIRRIKVFHGLDPGDHVEMTTDIYINGIPVVLRSDHKEVLTMYNAWESYGVPRGAQKRVASIDISCNVTGMNYNTDRFGEGKKHTPFCNRPDKDGKDTARAHWGFWFLR